MTPQRIIGKNNKIPWHLPADLKHFKKITMGKPIVMGRKTFESIGKALPGRRSIVLTRRADYQPAGVDVVSTPDAALQLAGDVDEVMIIGGAKVYEKFLPMSERIYLTRVHAEVKGDTFFPEIREDEWRIVSSQPLPPNDERPFSVSFQTLERI